MYLDQITKRLEEASGRRGWSKFQNKPENNSFSVDSYSTNPRQTNVKVHIQGPIEVVRMSVSVSEKRKKDQIHNFGKRIGREFNRQDAIAAWRADGDNPWRKTRGYPAWAFLIHPIYGMQVKEHRFTADQAVNMVRGTNKRYPGAIGRWNAVGENIVEWIQIWEDLLPDGPFHSARVINNQAQIMLSSGSLPEAVAQHAKGKNLNAIIDHGQPLLDRITIDRTETKEIKIGDASILTTIIHLKTKMVRLAKIPDAYNSGWSQTVQYIP